MNAGILTVSDKPKLKEINRKADVPGGGQDRAGHGIYIMDNI